MKTPSEIYPPFKVDVPMTDDETAFEDIEDDDAPGSSNDPHPSTPKSLNGMQKNLSMTVCKIFSYIIFLLIC